MATQAKNPVRETAINHLPRSSPTVQTAEGDRRKRVYRDKRKVAEMFLLGEEGRMPEPKVRMSTNGTRLRSYRTTIAWKARNGVALDPSRYSTTTSTHQNAVRSACRASNVSWVEIPMDVLNELDAPASRLYIVDGSGSKAVFRVNGTTYYRGHNGDDGSRWRHLGFVVELPQHADSIEEAENLLIPKKVKEATEQGLEIIRQGEWFFIPRPNYSPDTELQKPLQESKTHRERAKETGRFNPQYEDPDLGNHIARDKVRQLPTECPICHGSSFEFITEGDVSCTKCGNVVGPTIYVRGTVRHTDNDHRMVNLGETWHEAVTHGFEGVSFDTKSTGRYGRD